MKLVQLLNYAIVMFFAVSFASFMFSSFLGSFYDYEVLSMVVGGLLTISGILIWLLPMIIVFSYRDLTNKVVIFLVSLTMPIIGGVISYFVINVQVNKRKEQRES